MPRLIILFALIMAVLLAPFIIYENFRNDGKSFSRKAWFIICGSASTVSILIMIGLFLWANI